MLKKYNIAFIGAFILLRLLVAEVIILLVNRIFSEQVIAFLFREPQLTFKKGVATLLVIYLSVFLLKGDNKNNFGGTNGFF